MQSLQTIGTPLGYELLTISAIKFSSLYEGSQQYWDCHLIGTSLSFPRNDFSNSHCNVANTTLKSPRYDVAYDSTKVWKVAPFKQDRLLNWNTRLDSTYLISHSVLRICFGSISKTISDQSSSKALFPNYIFANKHSTVLGFSKIGRGLTDINKRWANKTYYWLLEGK